MRVVFPAARRALTASLDSGEAIGRFSRMVRGLGGPHDLVDCTASYLPEAAVVRDVLADRAGVVTHIDLRALGMAVVALGGGRMRPDDRIDYSVGFDRLLGLGERVAPGTPLARVHARTEDDAALAAGRLRGAYTIGDVAPRFPLVVERPPAETS